MPEHSVPEIALEALSMPADNSPPAPLGQKLNLLDMNRQQMREFFLGLGEKPFRADQVMKWIYHYCCDDFE